MLNVHHMKSTENPAALVGTMKQLTPSARPSSPEVLADNRHSEVRAIPAAVLAGDAVAQEAGSVSAAAHLSQEVVPLLARHTTVLEVGALVLAAVVEETDVVVLLLQRLDLRLDKVI